MVPILIAYEQMTFINDVFKELLKLIGSTTSNYVLHSNFQIMFQNAIA
jgi:hypothetical protein